MQRWTIVKYNIDNRHANIQAKIATKWFENNFECVLCISYNDRNKIKVKAPSKLSVLSQKKVIKVPTKIDLSNNDNNSYIKLILNH